MGLLSNGREVILSDSNHDVIVVGAGLAGLSAATELAARGARVLVLEARAVLGGRASSFTDRTSGEQVDNGQHLMLGCYRHTFAFLARIGASHHVHLQPRLEVPFVDEEGRETVLSCPDLPSPWHLLGGLMEWDALSWPDRLSALGLAGAIRRTRRVLERGRGVVPASAGETVEHWLIRNGQSRRLRWMLWEPLALAALNQPATEASSPPFLRVLAEMFGPEPRDAAVAVPRLPLTALLAEPARAFIEARGGRVIVSRPARVRIRDGCLAGVESNGDRFVSAGVVAAVPWFTLPALLVGEPTVMEPVVAAAQRAAPSPIVTVNLWVDRPVLSTPFVGLPGRTFQWVFDKRQILERAATHLSFVSSGAASILERSNEELASVAWRELVGAVPAARSATVVRSLVVRERRATFSLAPGQPARPGVRTPVAGLVLAGDWVDTGLPATIEGAVASGVMAAAAL